jgi:hypothetical protein
MPVLESMAAIFKYSYSGPMVGKEEGEYLSWHELSCQEKALLTEEMYNAIVTAYKISGN